MEWMNDCLTGKASMGLRNWNGKGLEGTVNEQIDGQLGITVDNYTSFGGYDGALVVILGVLDVDLIL